VIGWKEVRLIDNSPGLLSLHFIIRDEEEKDGGEKSGSEG